MNLGWFGVPSLGGSNGLDRLKPGLQAVRGCMVPMHAKKRKEAFDESIPVWGEKPVDPDLADCYFARK